MQRIVDIMARLRAPDGCPWDLAQTPSSLKPYVIEEAYEVCEAIESDDPQKLKEELGDLLLQVVFQAQIAQEHGHFAIDDVVNAISDKMERRHPHVFGSETAATAAEVQDRWEQNKAKERAKNPKEAQGMLAGIPKSLPALLKARRVTEKASLIGFDWPDAAAVHAKLDEEIAELRAAEASGDPEAIREELGDVLFTLVNLGRFLSADPEDALRRTLEKFMRRFRHVETRLAEMGIPLEDAGLQAMDALWDEAKRLEKEER